MRVAFFSPLPPARTGIADYAAALLEQLQRLARVDVFDREPDLFDPSAYDSVLYQIGNNPFHEFVYRTALRYPGTLVLHEPNLHHLVAEITIKKGDWDGYLAEVAYEGGAGALAYARRVKALEVGPDYDRVPMIRRLLENARSVIVHSRAVEDAVRAAGFAGPVGIIPHGAWIPETDRMGYRHRLGLEPQTPLAGIFGFLKPYKRIGESLRAFKRLTRLEPRARLILVGEPHPDFPVAELIHSLGLDDAVRVVGYVPIDDFSGYLAACDIVLNLRHPTLGESSGTLLRALGLGRAVLVSDVGSFREFPDDICLKVPVGPDEEDLIFEYLNLLVSRPSLAVTMGDRARRWVDAECNWGRVAEKYLSFLEAARDGRPWPEGGPPPAIEELELEPEPREGVLPAAEPEEPPLRHARIEDVVLEEPPAAPAPEPPRMLDAQVESVTLEEPQPAPEQRRYTPLELYLIGWAESDGAREYVKGHLTRLIKTLEITPTGTPRDRILEMGAYMQLTPALKTHLGYGEVRGCYYGPRGKLDHRRVVSEAGEEFLCDIDNFDAERDRFPYQDEAFSTVLCCELVEHLKDDPMHMLAEVNRVLRKGGHLVLTTPNIGSLRAISAILQGYHPGFFPAYLPPSDEETFDARHSREYTPREAHHLLYYAGFEVTLLETGEFLERPHPEHHWVTHLLDFYRLPADLRGDGIYVVGRKSGPVRERYPEWLYSGGSE